MGRTRRYLIALVSVAALALAAAGPAAAEGRGGGRVYGTIVTPIFTGAVDAVQHSADPRDVSGTLTSRSNPPLDGVVVTTGRIACLNIVGNTVGGVLIRDENAEPAIGRPLGYYIVGVDTGPGRPDRIGFLELPPSFFPGDCPPIPALSLAPATGGDFVVEPAR